MWAPPCTPALGALEQDPSPHPHPAAWCHRPCSLPGCQSSVPASHPHQGHGWRVAWMHTKWGLALLCDCSL